MEGFITNYYVSLPLHHRIEHVESKNVQACLMKLYFHPGTNMPRRCRNDRYVIVLAAFMPPGPSAVRDALRRRSVPSVFSFSPQDEDIGESRPALFRCADVATLPAFRAPSFVEQRTIVISLDPRSCLPTHAPTKSSRHSARATRSAFGTPTSPTRCRSCRSTRWQRISRNLRRCHPHGQPGRLHSRCGPCRRLGRYSTGYALVDGRRTVYIAVTKRADASTLSVVHEVKKRYPR